ncbi:hypothetical protein QBC43DRAFT_325516 [Cladorrhinum sp. PSN259]|nr:hypothetical protein QBC43DRAFT_325516 [Cladorrhinum sp. PSN259]
MDWPYESPEFSDRDLDRLFKYELRESKGIFRFPGDEESELDERTIKTDNDLKSWLDHLETLKEHSALGVIIANRHGQNQKHNPATLQYLPFTREGFEQMIKTVPLHGSTARTINRSDVAYFTDIDVIDQGKRSIYYCCRTSAATPGDLAVSSVFYPETGFTAAVVFGCSDDIADQIAARIDNSEDAWTHPMLVIGIVAEIERARHLELVQRRVFNLLEQVRAINTSEAISSTSELVKETYSVDLWISVSQLRIALETWKIQLAKMDAHITELERDILSGSDSFGEQAIQPNNQRSSAMRQGLQHRDSFSSQASEATITDDSELWKLSARKTGRKIQKRLREIMSEYDEQIRECSMVIDGMTLSAQLSWNQIGYQDTQTNLKIATATRQDSKSMRSIAFLTMFFLPATFLASVFSMTFFKWDASDGEKVVSPYIYIYVLLVVGITALVLGCWYIFTKRRRFFAAAKADEEKGMEKDKVP